MPYSNTGTPRFYISYGLWHITTGLDFLPNGYFEDNRIRDVLQLNPSSLYEDDRDEYHWFKFDDKNGFNFVFFLGHKFASDQNDITVKSSGTTVKQFDFSVNCSNGGVPDNDGWSLGGFNTAQFLDNQIIIYIYNSFTCNSIAFGKYFDMSHSPDLKLTMTREIDGAKRIRTKGGSDLVKHQYIKPAMWGSFGAWELHSGGVGNQPLSRSGRRVWGLSFSYLQDSDMFPDVSSLTNYETSGYELGDNVTLNTLLDSDNFYSQVIHKTNGGQLPFIFQPDSSDNTPQNFAICKFDMSSFKFDQVANGVYNVKLKIREVW